MNIQVISVFPDMFKILTDFGVVGRAINREILTLDLLNPRDFADDERNTVDDRPYGGGPGMVMMAQPLSRAIEAAKQQHAGAKVVYLSPQGRRFNHQVATGLADREALIVLAGRYEGVDERLLDRHVDEELSIGDYVLSGGELAAMVVIDAVARLLPDGLGNAESALADSFATGLLDHPHYTRPDEFEGAAVPNVLLSGDHKAIARWRMQQALGRTWLRRPDLLDKIELDDQQLALLEEFKKQ